MKELKKVLSVIVAVGMMAVMMIGCGQPKVTPEEAVKIELDVVLKADKSQIDKINMTEDEYNDLRDEIDSACVEAFGGRAFSSVTEEEKTQIKEAFLAGLSNITYEVGEAKVDKDTASVNISVKGMDFYTIMNNVQNRVMEKAKADPSLAADQNRAMSETIAIMCDEIKNTPVVDDAKDVEFTLTLDKDKNAWILSDANLSKLTTALYRM